MWSDSDSRFRQLLLASFALFGRLAPRTFQAFAGVVLSGGLLLGGPAAGVPGTVTHGDLPSCDFLAVPSAVDELGDPSLFPPDELILSVDFTTSISACPSADTAAVNALITTTNMTAFDFVEVWYVADPETVLTNADGIVNGEQAFRIDSVGLNTPLISESMTPDGVFEAGETWDFIIDDYFNTLGIGADAFFSPGGVGGGSPGGPSSGSIIAYIPAQAQYNIDHYIVYKVLNPEFSGLQADLNDQFGLSQALLWERDKFANPVDKTHPPDQPNLENLLFPDEHLSWWRFEEPYPNRTDVRVGNQFGPDQLWRLGDAEYLLVPAIKDQIGMIQLNQHYECYIALEAPDIALDVTLGDQFGVRPAVVGMGRYLCNPVEKLGPLPLVPSEPPPFPEDHLACYDIDPMPVDEIRDVDDQVDDAAGGLPLELIVSEMLCVPSTKSIVPDQTPSLAPWGIATLGLLMLLTVFWAAQRRARYGGPA